MSLFKQILLFVLVSGSCFGVGYWIGNSPRLYQKTIDLKQEVVTIYVENNETFPAPLLEIFKGRLNFKLEIINNSQFPKDKKATGFDQDPDLAILSHYTLNKIETNSPDSIFKSNAFKNWMYQNISPDFIQNDDLDKAAVPFLWKKNNNELFLWHLVPISTNKTTAKKVEKLIKELMSPEIMLLILEKTEFGTTLQTLDQAHISDARKASALRKSSIKDFKFIR